MGVDFVSVDLKVPLSSPSTAAPPGGLREHCLSNAIDSGVTSSGAPVGRGAQGTARFLRGER